MSFIDGIFSGIADVVRDVFGGDEPRKRSSSTSVARSNELARDTATTYERPVDDPDVEPGDADSHSTGSGSVGTGHPSLLRRIHDDVTARSTTIDPGPPSEGVQSPASQVERVTPAPVESPDTARTTTDTGRSTAARARVLDAGSDMEHGTTDTLGSSGSDAAVAARNVQDGIDYLARTFGRDGVDGAGSGVDVLIDDRRLDERGEERFKGNGGYYAMPDGAGGNREAIHFGTGTSYDAARGRVDQRSMLHADDLAIHELVHGVIRAETGHLGGEADEAGATNEAIADVMAASATRDWSMGEGMYTDASAYRRMRNIANPDDPTAVHGLWTNMSQLDGERAAGREVEEHWASGVISTAAYRVQQQLGGELGWNAVERVFYDSIDHARLGDMSFQAVAGALRTSAATLYGSGSDVAAAFDRELQRAGL